jgi:pimeloyl-ACP methyl ester carboxylesterase
VLVDIAPVTNRDGVERIIDFMRSGVDGFDSLEDAAVVIAAYTPQRVRAFNPVGLRKVLRERNGKWYWHWDPAIMLRERTEVATKQLQSLLDVAMNNIAVPTMLVRGMLSDVLTQEGVDHIVSRLPDITVVEVPGAGHMIAGDQNIAFTDAVTWFLAERIRPLLSL